MPATDTPEQVLEQNLALMQEMIKIAKEMLSDLEAIEVQYQERLYNLRHGDVPCPPTQSEE
jgi:hypothetical protein